MYRTVFSIFSERILYTKSGDWQQELHNEIIQQLTCVSRNVHTFLLPANIQRSRSYVQHRTAQQVHIRTLPQRQESRETPYHRHLQHSVYWSQTFASAFSLCSWCSLCAVLLWVNVFWCPTHYIHTRTSWAKWLRMNFILAAGLVCTKRDNSGFLCSYNIQIKWKCVWLSEWDCTMMCVCICTTRSWCTADLGMVQHIHMHTHITYQRRFLCAPRCCVAVAVVRLHAWLFGGTTIDGWTVYVHNIQKYVSKKHVYGGTYVQKAPHSQTYDTHTHTSKPNEIELPGNHP